MEIKNFRVIIETDNSAFDGIKKDEIVRILRNLADKMEDYCFPTILYDINGNQCGIVDYE